MSATGKHRVHPLITAEQIATRVRELGEQITADYRGRNPLLVCILKGAVPFLVDLGRHLDLSLQVDYLQASSYGSGTRSSGEVRLDKDLGMPIEGRHVLVIEDIVDTGRTLSYLIDLLERRSPASLQLCTLLDKPDRREVPVRIDYVGFAIPNEFVVGYGMDFDEQMRHLPFVGVYQGSDTE
jgi:hypoxanthine phosphoribosyltransferase